MTLAVAAPPSKRPTSPRFGRVAAGTTKASLLKLAASPSKSASPKGSPEASPKRSLESKVPRRRIERQPVRLSADGRVDFPAYFVHGRKVDQRRFVAQAAITWLTVQKKRGACGAIMVDIDDTLIDGHQCVQNGFQFMQELYATAGLDYPIHVVTARPDSDHASAMRMLSQRGFSIPTDRLHMLPAHLWGKETSHVERFKWRTYLTIGRMHQGVVARFGDMLWDVAHVDTLHTTLKHVHDRDCYVFLDPALGDTLSCKLPGAEPG